LRGAGGQDGEITGALEVRNLYFRYAPGEPEVLRGVSMQVRPGEFVAIAGASGCGKSTLLKLITGLYTPTYGEVLLDGRPLPHWNQRAVRSQIGTVMQDDVLLAGSIAENIAFFDDRIDMERVMQCAKLACIHDDITRMPMAYQTLVGDMGTSLSGGQQQRVMIARALYRQPKILIMDEGTSHLDVDTERAINAALSQMPITRIVVAHRPETIRAAARVLQLSTNGLVEHPREVV
jgi:ATP-binding cassette subfamily B protein RaxB